MPFPLETLIATPLIGLLAYIILGISGFGSALVTIPLLVHFLPLQTVVPLAVLVYFLATATTGIRYREDVEIAELKFLVPPMIAGIVVGVTLLATLPQQATLILLGAFVTGYGVYRLIAKASTKSVSRWWGVPTGLFGGLIGGLFGVGGPIYAEQATDQSAEQPCGNSPPARYALGRGFCDQPVHAVAGNESAEQDQRRLLRQRGQQRHADHDAGDHRRHEKFQLRDFHVLAIPDSGGRSRHKKKKYR